MFRPGYCYLGRRAHKAAVRPKSVSGKFVRDPGLEQFSDRALAANGVCGCLLHSKTFFELI